MGKENKCLKRVAVSAALIAGMCLLGTPVKAQETGESLFKAKCAMCHGPDGKAETAMGKKLEIKSFASPDVQKMSDADLSGIITKGKGKMPPYEGKLTKEQIEKLLGHIRELGKK